MTTVPFTPSPLSFNANPNEKLAIEITESLVSSGLIMDGHKTELISKLNYGGVSQDDWYLWVDLATTPQSVEEVAGDE